MLAVVYLLASDEVYTLEKLFVVLEDCDFLNLTSHNNNMHTKYTELYFTMATSD